MLIVAHPDDEIIFFSSVIKLVDKIIVCFGPSDDELLTEGRHKIIEKYPLKNIEWLQIPEANVYQSATWNKPKVVEAGLMVRKNTKIYNQNYKSLCKLLKLHLANFDEIYTHNPWGEYGHEEHISVFNAVASSINREYQKLYVSAYVSDRSMNLMTLWSKSIQADMKCHVVPENLCRQIKDLYCAENCWTWDDEYIWPNHEIFFKINPYFQCESVENRVITARLPVMVLTKSFKWIGLKKILSLILTNSIKRKLKRVINRN